MSVALQSVVELTSSYITIILAIWAIGELITKYRSRIAILRPSSVIIPIALTSIVLDGQTLQNLLGGNAPTTLDFPTITAGQLVLLSLAGGCAIFDLATRRRSRPDVLTALVGDEIKVFSKNPEITEKSLLASGILTITDDNYLGISKQTPKRPTYDEEDDENDDDPELVLIPRDSVGVVVVPKVSDRVRSRLREFGAPRLIPKIRQSRRVRSLSSS